MLRRSFLTLPAFAYPLLAADDRQQPEALYQSIMRDAGLQLKGEDFCWHAGYHVHYFLRAYQAWQDTAWLDQGLKYYEFLVAHLDTGPDGYQGWIGPYEYDHSVWCDVHVGDAVLFNGLLAFAEAVLADPKLRAKYGVYANKYVDLARKHLFEKWDARGTWEQDGPYGAYRSWNRYGDPESFKDWTVRNEVAGSGLALPFNKQDDVGVVALKLYRITGDDHYRDRATRIFAYHKSRLGLVDDYYYWNYWEPYAQADLDLPKHKCRHWVGVHPERPYQMGEVANIVEAYHTGVVFDATDIRRIINTNLKVMWNGSLDEPAFRNSNAQLPGANPKQTAGKLWPALADFDDIVRKLYAKQLASVRDVERTIEKAYFENVTSKRTATMARRMVRGKPTVFEFPFAPCSGFILTAALPGSFSMKDGTILTSETLTKGVIEVAQYSADGKQKLAALGTAEQQWYTFLRWTPSAPGNYRIRWSFEGGGYREAPVTCNRNRD